MSQGLLFSAPPRWAVQPRLTRSPPETVTATVQLRDIDLSTARGMVVARSRIAAMALRLCERFRNTSSVSDSQTAERCDASIPIRRMVGSKLATPIASHAKL
jgi:UrcA family protein